MRELISEGRALMLDWKNKENADGTYDVTFDDGPPYYGREFKGVKWRTVAGHRVLVTKKGNVVGVPDRVSKDLTGDPDKPLNTSGKTPEDAPDDTPEKGDEDVLGGLDPEKAAEHEKVENETLAKVKKMKPSEALDHLETLQEMPVTAASAKGKGLFGFLGKLFGGLAEGALYAVNKIGSVARKMLRRAAPGISGAMKDPWAYVTGTKEYRQAVKDHEKAITEAVRANKLYTKHQEALNKQLTKKYRESDAQKRAQEVRARAEAVLKQAQSAQVRLEKLMGKPPKKAPAKPSPVSLALPEPPKTKERKPWTSAGKMQRELEKLKDPREAEKARRDEKLARAQDKIRKRQAKDQAEREKRLAANTAKVDRRLKQMQALAT